MNKSLIKHVVELLKLTKPVVYVSHNRIIRKQISNKSFRVIGYYTLAYSEEIGQHHRIDYSKKVCDINDVIIHELIHAWQAENLQWQYGHGSDFESIANGLAKVLDYDVEDIISPAYY